MRRLVSLLFLGGFILLPRIVLADSEAQPPYEVKDPAVTNNFREIYYAADRLSLLSSLFNYTLDSSNNLFCINSPTFCVDAVNHRVGILTASPGFMLHLSTAAPSGDALFVVQNSSNTGYATVALRAQNGASNGDFVMRRYGNGATGTSAAGLSLSNLILLTFGSTDPSGLEFNAGSGSGIPIVFGTGAGTNERMRITDSLISTKAPVSISTLTVTSSFTAVNATLTTTNLNVNGLMQTSSVSPSSGMALVAFSASAAPTFTYKGRILQVVVGNTVSASSTTTSVTFAASNITASITPIENGSRIFIFANVNRLGNTTSGKNSYVSLYRGSTNLAAGGATDSLQTFIAQAANDFAPCSVMTTDAPATTSATTYAVYFMTDSGGTAFVGGGGLSASVTLVEVGQ